MLSLFSRFFVWVGCDTHYQQDAQFINSFFLSRRQLEELAARRAQLGEQSSESAARRAELGEQSSESRARRAELGERSSESRARRAQLGEQSSESAARRESSESAARRAELGEQSSESRARRAELGEPGLCLIAGSPWPSYIKKAPAVDSRGFFSLLKAVGLEKLVSELFSCEARLRRGRARLARAACCPCEVPYLLARKTFFKLYSVKVHFTSLFIVLGGCDTHYQQDAQFINSFFLSRRQLEEQS